MVLDMERVNDGSSPRMWGTHEPPISQFHEVWFIPTHVGNSAGRIGEQRGLKVHPHACGELIFRSVRTNAAIGSSPRMWGTHITT